MQDSFSQAEVEHLYELCASASLSILKYLEGIGVVCAEALSVPTIQNGEDGLKLFKAVLDEIKAMQ